MEYFNHPQPEKKVLIAGTYSAHPVPTAAAIATLKKLKTQESEIYGHLEHLGQMMEAGLKELLCYERFPRNSRSTGIRLCRLFHGGGTHQLAANCTVPRYGPRQKVQNALDREGYFSFPTPHQTGEHLLRPHRSGHRTYHRNYGTGFRAIISVRSYVLEFVVAQLSAHP